MFDGQQLMLCCMILSDRVISHDCDRSNQQFIAAFGSKGLLPCACIKADVEKIDQGRTELSPQKRMKREKCRIQNAKCKR